MESNVIFLFAGIMIIGVILFALVTFNGRSRAIDVSKYRVRWLAIEQSLVKGTPSSYHLAVLNADKLVDQALRDKGYGGKTMGERLKSASSRLTRRDDVWRAHKLRNKIAHETDIAVSYDDAREALRGFKSALKEMGII